MTAHHFSNFQNLVISFDYSWLLPKNLSNFIYPALKTPQPVLPYFATIHVVLVVSAHFSNTIFIFRLWLQITTRSFLLNYLIESLHNTACKEIWIFGPIWENLKNYVLLWPALYWTESEKFVYNNQQCFAFQFQMFDSHLLYWEVDSLKPS